MILAIVDALLLQPLMQVYSTVFRWLPVWLEPGPRLIAFSVILNVMLLPIYSQMERNSRGLRETKDQVGREVDRMRRYFHGRERYFYIRAVHRQYHYHPISALFGSTDLFIQVLVFATVYRFLSDLPSLRGQSFGPIADLSRPDGLLGGANLLPFVMTAINVASVLVYVGGRRMRQQGLGLAAVFLLLLYGSPSGLVCYWAANNLFSLIRNVLGRRAASALPAWLERSVATIARQE